MQVKSTVQNSRVWRHWHAFNYFVGGSTFLLGSVALFPILDEFYNAAEVSAWLYTIGSFTFLLADITEWLHYTKIDCPHLSLSINFLISLLGSALYLVGSACYIPALELADLGSVLFIIGSAVIVVAQGWKIYRVMTEKERSITQAIQQDESGFYVDLFAGLGALMYFIGTFVFNAVTTQPNYLVPAVTIYSFGGVFFFGSGLFMQKRYFFQQKDKDYSPASTATSSDI